MCAEQAGYSYGVDVWGVACVMLEMVLGQVSPRPLQQQLCIDLTVLCMDLTVLCIDLTVLCVELTVLCMDAYGVDVWGDSP